MQDVRAEKGVTRPQQYRFYGRDKLRGVRRDAFVDKRSLWHLQEHEFLIRAGLELAHGSALHRSDGVFNTSAAVRATVTETVALCERAGIDTGFSRSSSCSPTDNIKLLNLIIT